MATALASSLSGLTTREAIQDAIFRAVTAIDIDDLALFDSAFTRDTVFDLAGYRMDGIEAVTNGCFHGVAKLDTTHFINNIRIDVKEGATTAKLTATALAQHYRPGEGVKPGSERFLAGSLYDIDLVKESDGVWRIKVWNLKIVWGEGDRSIVAGTGA